MAGGLLPARPSGWPARTLCAWRCNGRLSPLYKLMNVVYRLQLEEPPMSRIMQSIVGFTVLAVFAGSATLASPASTQLPPEIGWTTEKSSFVMHLNVERVANSVLAPMLDNPFRVEEPEDRVWQKLFEKLPMTLGEDVRSITVIGVGPLETDLVAVCRMSERADKLPTIMAEHIPGYRATDIDGYTVHSWSEIVEDKRRHIFAHPRTISATERMWIIASDWEHLLDAIALAERMDEDDALLDLPGDVPPAMEHSALFVHLPKSAFSGMQDAVRRQLDHVDWITIDIAATATDCSVRLTGGMSSERGATELAQIAQGMLALGRMSLREDESMRPIMRLIERTRVVADGSKVLLELHAEAELFTEAFEVARPQIGAAREAGGRFRLELGAEMDKPNGGDE